MRLGFRKILVIGLIAGVLLLGNILVVANWLTEKGFADKANWIRQEFLTGTAITITVVLLILLVGNGKGSRWRRRCPVCDERLITRGKYCPDCGCQT